MRAPPSPLSRRTQDFASKPDDFDASTDPEMNAYRAKRKATVVTLQAFIDCVDAAKAKAEAI